MKNHNNKAVSTPLVLLIIAIIVVAVLAAAFSMGTTPETIQNDVVVYIDSIQQTNNYTEPQALSWPNTQAGNTYTKNFTVANTAATPYNLYLYTTEPMGTSQSWSFNNTQLAASNSAQGTLTLTLSTMPAVGAYTWQLFASNSTLNPTPTPTPSIPPIVNMEFTLTTEVGVENITVAINTDKITLISTDLPATFQFTSVDTLTFKTNAAVGYTFNTWLLNDATIKSANPLVLTDLTGNFTVQAKYLLTP
jgi:hypothetical protein